MTSLITTTTPTDEVLLSTLIASHGSVSLAAERLNISTADIYSRVPTLNYDNLVTGIKSARILHAFDAWTVMKDVVFLTLEELTPERRAKFMIEFMDRFETMLNPPVHGGSGQPASNNTNIQLNLGSSEASEDARASLAKRLIDVSTAQQRESVEYVQAVISSPADGASEHTT
jgi:hypothetical protein